MSHCKKATLHQVATMLASSKSVLFPGHNHLLITGTDDPLFGGTQAVSVGSSVTVVSSWLWPGNRTFYKRLACGYLMDSGFVCAVSQNEQTKP